MAVVWGRRGVNDVTRTLKIMLPRPVYDGIPEGSSALPEPDKKCEIARVSRIGLAMNNDILNVGPEVRAGTSVSVKVRIWLQTVQLDEP